MIIAQIRGGRVLAAYSTDPRTTGFTTGLPADIEFADASSYPDVAAGWYAAPIDIDNWAFGATPDDLNQALTNGATPSGQA
jgi:hypothetical protein